MANIKELETTVAQKQLVTGQSLADLTKRIDVVKRFEEILGTKTPGFIASLLSLYNASPQLKKCEPRSILSSAMIAATLDLPINPTLGFAAIVPYKDQAQFQIMTRGLIQLAIRTGAYKSINAAEVYEGEIINYNRVTGSFEIDENNRKSEKIVGYVAYFKLHSGFEKYLYMTVEQIRNHAKKFSKSYGNPHTPWTTNFDGMALKTVTKLLLSKYGILSVEMNRNGKTIQEEGLQKAIEFDQAVVLDSGESASKVTYPDNPQNDVDMPNDAQEPI